MMELRLYRGEVREDVGVIVFEVVDDECPWPVVHELRAPIEIRSVVFVGFDDKKRRTAEARRTAKIERHAADQKSGVETRAVEDMCEHARSRRFAVCTGYREHPPALQDF